MLRRTLTLATVLGRATVATSLKPVSRRRAAASVAGAASGLAGRRLFASAADFAKTASGLQVQDLEAGAGAEPLPGQTVKVHYTGWLEGFGDDGKKFDSSYDRGKPLAFAVGTGRVIKGWDEALLSMKIGGKRRVIIPAELGYGAKGAGGIIPGGATLYFEMNLLSAQ
mmetsp:Transcript_10971/g.32746  ORF Transcript_10971/g.32746 Transcript_10971/m.32746 type:complete len:168 (+) Transcript_10971:254-757(+)|eukprot:CAMPEP_0119296714 /NCGR_PEP_ID=MMETSP1329-20130426/50706_1 /TAXON_ID=114041 /ORGANISM="Genus nov. species nov., Strain RCC1024" /LENGTH=167 /DNA_ID=CAMNT_0007297651 /DNA_START=275 /DNA_END=778 /DNA_ORIENTATION=+